MAKAAINLTGTKPEKEKELKTTLAQIEKQFGEGAIRMLGDATCLDVPCISTGSLGIDVALGGRGLPRGRVIEIFGHEASGKTTVTLHTIAEAQKEGGVAAFIDAEHALDPSWAKRLGVDLEGLLVSQPQSAEEALKIAEMLIRSNAVDIIVLDSVAALVPRAEVDGEIGDQKVGAQARLMSQALRILNPLISKTKTCMIFINQIRQKIGVMFGSPDTTSGGLALKFYSSVRMEVRKSTTIKRNEETIGALMKVKIVKNKIAPPFQLAEIDLLHEMGFDKVKDTFDTAAAHNVITKTGNYYDFKDQRIALGKDKCVDALRENPAMVAEIAKALRDQRSGYVVPNAEIAAIATPPSDNSETAAVAESEKADSKKQKAK